MAIHNFRILLETVEGGKTSYYSSSFVDTSTDLVLSASQVYDRITGSVSCSYYNAPIFEGDINNTYVFSLPGSPSACKDGWDNILKYQLDIRHKPCNFIEIIWKEYIDPKIFPC